MSGTPRASEEEVLEPCVLCIREMRMDYTGTTATRTCGTAAPVSCGLTAARRFLWFETIMLPR